MEQAIKIAIENGYYEGNAHCQQNGNTIAVCYPNTTRIDTFIDKYQICLDPLFWQALGKGLGWRTKAELGKSHDTFFQGSKGQSIDECQYKQYNFIDHLAEGKDIDSFFKSLLTK